MFPFIVAAGLSGPHPNTMETITESWNRTLVIGHRGAAAYKPENTPAAFEEAILAKAAAAECDIHLDKDGGVVVIHDSTLDRTTHLTGKVAEKSTEELKAARIPYLADFTRVTKGRIVSVIEIKGGEGIEEKLVDHLKKEEMMDQTIVFSFSSDRIARVKQLVPKLYAVWLVALPGPAELYETNVFAKAAACKADGIGVQYNNALPELVAQTRKRNMPIFVWTVPPGPEVDRLKSLKVNFIITDYPREVMARLGKK